MPRVRVQDFLEDEEMDLPTFEPIRTNSDPISGRQTLQRRSEDIGNRYRRENRDND
jgi:hypothetical protein